MDEFLTLKEVVAHSTSSGSTIRSISMSSLRRLVEPITKDPTHPNRDMIEPSVVEVARLKENNKKFRWRVSLEFLEWEFPKTKDNAKPKTGDDGGSRLGSKQSGGVEVASVLQKQLEVLQGQLYVKDTQIQKQHDVITQLNERLREGNVLMNGLQEQLQLPEGKTSGKKDGKKKFVDAEVESAKKKIVVNAATKKATEKQLRRPKKIKKALA